jgi:hypothetical protein
VFTPTETVRVRRFFNRIPAFRTLPDPDAAQREQDLGDAHNDDWGDAA